LSQFEVAFYDTETNIIYIDASFRNSSLLPKILGHERAHARSTKLMDWDVEIGKGLGLQDLRLVLGHKPLFMFAAFMPFIWVSPEMPGGRFIWGIDLLRLVTLAVLIDVVFLSLLSSGVILPH